MTPPQPRWEAGCLPAGSRWETLLTLGELLNLSVSSDAVV